MAALLHALFERQRFHRTLRVLGGALMLAAGVLTVAQLVRASFLSQPKDYYASRPTLATFHAPLAPPGEDVGTETDVRSGIVAHWSCMRPYGRCSLEIARAGMGPQSEGAGRYGVMLLLADESFRVTYDAANRALLVVSSDGRFLGAVDDITGRWLDLSAASVARLTAPPRGWSLGALAALVFVAGILLTQRRARSHFLEQTDSFREGERIGGTVQFHDGTSPMVSGSIEIDGPVLVHDAHSRSATHYRDHGVHPTAFILAGTRASLREAAESAALGRLAYGFAVLLLATAPLLAFTWCLVR
jgi:hypothetical protein